MANRENQPGERYDDYRSRGETGRFDDDYRSGRDEDRQFGGERVYGRPGQFRGQTGDYRDGGKY